MAMNFQTHYQTDGQCSVPAMDAAYVAPVYRYQPGLAVEQPMTYPTPQGYEESKTVYGNELVGCALSAIDRQASGDASGLDMILSGKKELLRSKIELLLIQLSQRKAINQRILTGIDYDSCGVGNIILELGDQALYQGKTKIQLEHMRFDLEKQRRMEMASYFRDTAMINRDLKDALIDYIKENQTELLLGD